MISNCSLPSRWTEIGTEYFCHLRGTFCHAASDRRAGDYVYFQSFGKPDVPFKNLENAAQVRDSSARYFESDLATCNTTKSTCDADNVYELADRFCQALEFDEAVTWRLSRKNDVLKLHWAVCGLKK